MPVKDDLDHVNRWGETHLSGGQERSLDRECWTGESRGKQLNRISHTSSTALLGCRYSTPSSLKLQLVWLPWHAGLNQPCLLEVAFVVVFSQSHGKGN